MEIIPSILVTSAEEFLQQIKAVAGSVNQVQIDITDGEFVPITTWADPQTVQENLTTNCELHLMVNHPLEIIAQWSKVPQVRRVLFPVEYDGDIIDVVDAIHHHGWQAGLVLNPETTILMVEPFADKLDAVMFMGVNPGKQGQSFIPEVLEKMAEFKTLHPEIFVELDGGVNEATLPDIVKTGIDAVCPGSAVFRNERTPAENIKILKNICSTS